MEDQNQQLPKEEEKNLPESYSFELDEAERLLEGNEEEQADDDDYSALTKEEIIAKAESLLHTANVRKAQTSLNALKEALDTLVDKDRPAQIKAWTDEGNDPREFKAAQDPLQAKFSDIARQFRDKREEERKRAEEEKLANLKLKEQVLEKMRDLISAEENENSLKDMRELMREWREVRQVPKEFQDELYKRYRFYVDKFYDNLSIFNELKDLDREKNMEVKIELIKKVEALKEETNLRKALVMLNKYHEDWKNSGPVKQEFSEDVWSRFKAASDSLIAEKRAAQEVIEKEKEANLAKKQLLVEKAEAAIAVFPDKIREWGNLAKEIDALMDEWKKTGPVPREHNQSIWSRFRAARTAFFDARREFFKDLNASKEENLEAKIKLCEKAEKLKDGEDFNKTTDALNQLQEEWKKVGPVPEAKNDEVWKRFRAAFDHFYNRKNEFFQNRRAQEKDAVKEKEAVIAELEKLSVAEEAADALKKLKELQLRWVNSGFVSGKTFYNLQKKYQDLNNLVFEKFRKSGEDLKETMMKDHYEVLASAPDGKHKLQGEERRLKERLQKLRDEVATIENNKSFFAHSKNAGDVLKQFDANIKKASVQIEKLEKELKLLRSMKN